MKPMLWLAACLVAVLPIQAAENDSRTGPRPETVTVRTTIVALDEADRTVTLRDEDGSVVTLYADETVAGFDRLEVGDEVTFRYVVPVILQVHRLDQPATSGSRGQTFRGSPWSPAGLVARHVTERVTVEEVDPADPSLTFENEDGDTVSLPVDHREILRDLHPGDAIDITYTHPILVSVD